MRREKIVRKVGTIEDFEEQPLSTHVACRCRRYIVIVAVVVG